MSPKFGMLPNQAISSDKSLRFSPLAAAQPLTIRSRPETLNAGGFRGACMMASNCDACPCVFEPMITGEAAGVLARPEDQVVSLGDHDQYLVCFH